MPRVQRFASCCHFDGGGRKYDGVLLNGPGKLRLKVCKAKS
jgi:hypothetical protein